MYPDGWFSQGWFPDSWFPEGGFSLQGSVDFSGGSPGWFYIQEVPSHTFSCLFWVRRTSSVQSWLFSKREEGSNNEIAVLIQPTPAFQVLIQSQGQGIQQNVGSLQPQIGEWYFVKLTYQGETVHQSSGDGTLQVKIYDEQGISPVSTFSLGGQDDPLNADTMFINCRSIAGSGSKDQKYAFMRVFSGIVISDAHAIREKTNRFAVTNLGNLWADYGFGSGSINIDGSINNRDLITQGDFAHSSDEPLDLYAETLQENVESSDVPSNVQIALESAIEESSLSSLLEEDLIAKELLLEESGGEDSLLNNIVVSIQVLENSEASMMVLEGDGEFLSEMVLSQDIVVHKVIAQESLGEESRARGFPYEEDIIEEEVISLDQVTYIAILRESLQEDSDGEDSISYLALLSQEVAEESLGQDDPSSRIDGSNVVLESTVARDRIIGQAGFGTGNIADVIQLTDITSIT